MTAAPAFADMGVPQIIPPRHPIAWGILIIFLASGVPLAILIRKSIKEKRISPLASGGVLLALIGFLPTAFCIFLSFVIPQSDKSKEWIPYVETLKDIPKGKVIAADDVQVQLGPPGFIREDGKSEVPLKVLPLGRVTHVAVPQGASVLESMLEPKAADPKPVEPKAEE